VNRRTSNADKCMVFDFHNSPVVQVAQHGVTIDTFQNCQVMAQSKDVQDPNFAGVKWHPLI
jgi:hypothetical protein